jgi:signal transduction histidine kinase
LRTWNRWLRFAIYAVCVAAFVADLLGDATLAFGVFYIPLVSTAVYHRDPRAAWWLALLASSLVLIGFFIPHIDPDLANGAINRLLSVAAIFIMACLLHNERWVRDQLAMQTTRAASADLAKSRLFNNLSHELRTPLSAILGFADLLIADARPDQKAGLFHIQSGGRRLLATLDNLIDLTQFAERPLRARKLDLVAVLLQAVEASRAPAAERQITLTIATTDADLPPVVADGWALRRIIDNLLANGIKFTEPGGAVDVSARRMQEGFAVSVRDTGAGMPPDVLEQIGEPFFQADAGASRRYEGMGTGLALSRHLADAMGARLHFESTPGSGTTASLILPVGG